MNGIPGMVAPGRMPCVRRGGFLIAMFLICLLLRLPLLIYPPSDFYYNFDELSVTLCALDRFLGLPSTLLMLPSSFLQFLFQPVFLVDMVMRRGLPLSSSALLSELSSHLSQSYVDPHHPVLLMRCLVAFLCSAGPVLAYCITETLCGSKWVALFGAGFVLFNPVFLQHSVMAGGDAVAITLVLGSMLCLLKTKNRGGLQWAGFLFAAGMASRITVTSFATVPLIFLLLDDRIGTWSERTKALARFCTGWIFGFLFWCPYVWIDPIRMAKAVYGNVNRSESYLDLKAFTEVWWQGLGAGFTIAWLVFLVAGGLMVLRRRQAMGLATIAGSLLICLPLVVRASTVMPRYFLPLLPCLVLLLGVVAGEAKWIFAARGKIWNSMYVFLAIVAAAMATNCVAREQQVRGQEDMNEVMKVIPSLPRETVLYLPQGLIGEGRFQLPHVACERLRAKLQDMTGVIHFMEGRGIPGNAAEVLVTDFNEKEQAAAAHMAITCRTAPEDAQSIYLYYSPGDFAIERSLADMDLASALEHTRTGRNSAILVEGLQVPWGTPFWRGKGNWYWYKSPETHP